jgi:hypothetical protein
VLKEQATNAVCESPQIEMWELMKLLHIRKPTGHKVGISSETQHKHCSWLLQILGWWWNHTYDECNWQNLLTCTI